MVHIVIISNFIEHVKLVFRTPPAFIGYTGLPHISLGACGDVAWIVDKDQVGICFKSKANEAQGRAFPERVHKPCAKIGDQDHITGFHTL
jgi:hypothetical protein